MTARRPLPSWVTGALVLPPGVLLVVAAWAEAGPGVGVATLAVLVARPVARLLGWSWWEELAPPGKLAAVTVPRRSVAVTLGLLQLALGVTLVVVSSGPVGVALGYGLGVTALLGMVLELLRPTNASGSH